MNLCGSMFQTYKIYVGFLVQFKSESRNQHHETNIAFLIAEREVELSLKVNNAAYHGSSSHLKSLIKSGADPNRPDYDGRTPLVK